MPFFKVTTNQKLSKQNKNWLLNAMHKLVAEELGKPDKYIMTAISCDVDMRFGDAQDETAFVEFKSIGLPDTKQLSAAICKLLEQEIAIPPHRVYIEFTDEPRNMFGYNGTTF
ncbi:MAG: phenylpyruvate tautomerase MIF-related protein [Salinivirgaceae bacterium]|jgi:phenylpyruvate tautomerase|nr:phenylpyruvate tautomerase MIF-related protein [Salinivirgaceae bacterium]